MAARFKRDVDRRTSSPSTPPAAPPTRACAATRRSSSPRCSTRRSPSASTPWPPATTRRSSSAADGRRELHRAVDTAKDQSYVLGVLDADQLARSFFPLGDTDQAARSAQRPRSAASTSRSKPDSHDICFIADGDTRGLARRARLGEQPGEIVDAERARSSAQHAGRLRLHRRPATGPGPATGPPGRRSPRYVVEVRPRAPTSVVVGTADLLGVNAIRGDHARWCGPRARGRRPRRRPGARARRGGRGPGLGRGRPGRGAARGPAPRRRPGPVGRALRRHARGRVGHDRGRPPRAPHRTDPTCRLIRSLMPRGDLSADRRHQVPSGQPQLQTDPQPDGAQRSVCGSVGVQVRERLHVTVRARGRKPIER